MSVRFAPPPSDTAPAPLITLEEAAKLASLGGHFSPRDLRRYAVHELSDSDRACRLSTDVLRATARRVAVAAGYGP